LAQLSRCSCARVLFLSLLMSTLGAGRGSAEERLALVIGNGGYQHVAPLTNPPNDARLTADTLKTVGFRLVGEAALVNAERAAMEHAIRDFGRQLRGGAVGLFYYAGHGVQIDGQNYLVPVGADVEDAADVKYELIDLGYVLDEMKNAGNRLNIVILDACRNNPFGGRGLRALTRGLAQIQAPEGTIISYATQPGNTASDGAGKNSPFTRALTLSLLKPGLSVFDTFNDVGLAVEAATGGQQQPWLSHSPIQGSFQFHAGTAAPSAPPANAGEGATAADDRAFWASVKDSKSPAELQAYLQRFPQGIYAPLASARLGALKSAAAGKATTPRAAQPTGPAVPSGSAAAERAAQSAAPLTYPSTPPLQFGHTFLQSVVTAANPLGSRRYAALPQGTKVAVYASNAEAGGSYEVVATLAHSNPCTFHHCTVKDAIEPLSAKARELGANGIVIDSSQEVKTSLTSTGIVVQARAIRLP
jgi:uncharacterized caspase-like protein